MIQEELVKENEGKGVIEMTDGLTNFLTLLLIIACSYLLYQLYRQRNNIPKTVLIVGFIVYGVSLLRYFIEFIQIILEAMMEQ